MIILYWYTLYIILVYFVHVGRLADCNRSGCDLEGDFDWHMSYKVTQYINQLIYDMSL